MITNQDWTGKRVEIVGKHSHAGEKGTVECFEKTIVGIGIKIKLDSGEGCFVFTPKNLKVLK